MADLARELGTPKSSLAALLRGLSYEGFVVPVDGGWRLGAGANMAFMHAALVVTDPQPGDVIIWNHTVDPAKPQGHVAILTEVVKVDGAVAALAGIAGNTSADGASRNGDRVAEHPVSYPDPRIAGYLRIVPA